MRYLKSILVLALLMPASLLVGSDEVFATQVADLDDPALADWIGPPAGDSTGLFLFRKTFFLESVPGSFPVHLSADPRYRLFVNGKWITFGPAAGEAYHWNYETLDLVSYLQTGDNIIAVEVCQPGDLGAPRNVSFGTGMILKGPVIAGKPLLSDSSWKVLRSPGWHPLPMNRTIAGGGYIAGATEHWDASLHPQDWTSIEFEDAAWPQARTLGKGSHGALNTWKGTPWKLQPRELPLIEAKLVPANDIRRVTGLPGSQQFTGFPLTVPPHSTVNLLLDRGVLDMGFPYLEVSGGAGSQIQLRYQEALFHPDGSKGNRNIIEGKVMKGIYDEFRPDGSAQLVFEPAWIRCFRYIEVTAESSGEPLVLNRFQVRQTRYPFEVRGGFVGSDPTIQPILQASWRTLDLCALETYMDCPYYEQIQYIGDTRIQALISLYLTGDDRLMRNAIRQFHHSRQPIGLTRSAYPVNGQNAQLIPPFSLLYVGMVHDYFMHRDDPGFIQPLLPGIRYTLEWFVGHLEENNLLGPLPYWNHTDGGARGFDVGAPPGAVEGGSIQISLMLAIALDHAAELFQAHQREHEAEEFRALSARIKAAANTLGWSDDRGLYAETPRREAFSQHTNALAILAGIVPQHRLPELADRIVAEESLIQATLYFQFYVFSALREAGRGDLILGELDRWREMLALGLSTFPEHGPESRSDCHAWSAHPLYHLLATTAGVMPAAPGFRSVKIRPAPGELETIEALVCHPRGMIEVNLYETSSGVRNALINLPEGVDGTLSMHGYEFDLIPGQNHVQLPPKNVDGRAQ